MRVQVPPFPDNYKMCIFYYFLKYWAPAAAIQPIIAKVIATGLPPAAAEAQIKPTDAIPKASPRGARTTFGAGAGTHCFESIGADGFGDTSSENTGLLVK